MPKISKSIFLILFFLFLCPVFILAEEITITTYYPSPYGIFNSLGADKLGVGEMNDGVAGFTSADVPTDSGDAWIAGNLGIGTTDLKNKLQLGGDIGMDRNAVKFGDPGSEDVGISRYDTATLSVGNGTAADYSGNLLATALGANALSSLSAGSAISFQTGGTQRMVLTSATRLGIGTALPGYTLSVAGTIWANGSAIVAGNTTWSDIRLKENIEVIQDCLNKVLKLNGVYYTWKENEFTKNFTKGRQIGIIAQEMEKEFPELVWTDQEGYKTISYDKLTAVLLEAIKAQQNEIEQLKARLDKLEEKPAQN